MVRAGERSPALFFERVSSNRREIFVGRSKDKTLTSSLLYRIRAGMKKRKHGQLPSVKEMFKWQTKTS